MGIGNFYVLLFCIELCLIQLLITRASNVARDISRAHQLTKEKLPPFLIYFFRT